MPRLPASPPRYVPSLPAATTNTVTAAQGSGYTLVSVSSTALAGTVLFVVEYRETNTFNNGYWGWEHRLFLVFAPSAEDARYVRQTRLLEGAARDGFAERDLLRGDLFERETGTFDGGPVAPEHAAWAWDRCGVEPGRFAAVLVGKDGTVKHRSGEPIEPENLYALIDEMPIRRRGMRERRG
jgi:hypothetical protein